MKNNCNNGNKKLEKIPNGYTLLNRKWIPYILI